MKLIRAVRLLLASTIAVAVMALPAVAEARTKVLQPAFLVKISNASAEQTEAALRRSLAGRHWTITKEVPNEIEAKLVVRDHSITTRFSWSATQVAIVYVASENMDYEVDGDKTYIDRYYYRWLKYLKRDIINFSKRAGGSTGSVAKDDDADTDDDDKDDDKPKK